MEIKKYEQQLKTQTVSIRKLYEWLHEFLFEVNSKLKNNGKLAKEFEDIISAELRDCEKEYSNYLSSRKNVLKLANGRKKFYEQLNKSNKQLSELVLDCQTICTGNNVKTIADFRKVNRKKISIKEIENILNSPKFSDEDFTEFKNLYTAGTPKLMNLCSTYNNSKKSLEKDLKRIKGEGKIKALVFAAIKKKNINKKILIAYVEKVIPILKKELDKLKQLLSNNGIDPEKIKHIQAIEQMIKCWENDYNPTKIEKAHADGTYCHNLGLKLSKICGTYNVAMTNDIPTLFMQLSTRLTMMLKDFNSKNIAMNKNSQNQISEWIKDFEKIFTKITPGFSEVHVVRTKDNKEIIFPVDIVDFSKKIRNLASEIEALSEELNSQFNSEVQNIVNQFAKICPSH